MPPATEASDNLSPTPGETETRIITDIYGRQVEIPAQVESIASIGGAARILTYAGCAHKLIGVTEMDKSNVAAMPYSVVNAEHFQTIATVGTGGSKDTVFHEELITLSPDVIFALTDIDTINDVQEKTGIPVVAIYPTDMFDESLYTSLTIIGDVMGTQERCQQVVDFIKACRDDLYNRTKDIPDAEKPTVYTGAVSFRGARGFEGTYGAYPPFDAIGAVNVVDETGQTGGIIIDLEKVVAWDPDIIFLNPANMNLVNDHYKTNRSFYESLTAVREGRVFSQISYNYNWTNIEIAIADTYYAGKIIFPDAFADIDPIAKADEIFEVMLGQPFYRHLEEAGYTFGPITIGE
ncbi:MAG: iron ABC transporter substrate-binding protein [Clostridiales bacterium]|nr:iron ABC transporter substrate-binding protein [Clostridiales bacterium]